MAFLATYRGSYYDTMGEVDLTNGLLVKRSTSLDVTALA
jgi:hypothetical protein